ncbi:WXG100 family type VII secretion target [Mycobacterium sherrisii]|uniref:WXG100 family type VII secretion target n=1 Tax=Mycobacterium sherrisii TaxID=243061 RepID=UPI000A16A8BB|nr:WXG100 family type VII secretion target [Mycobacterium sherrisii]MCV7029362.1 WXG100 family type VII secretion target [Mycobacterium sherrisii]MEC4764483.1 WXG100 family type VII secretion target [Mycobacterium sherrisii]ORW75589.1 secretion protein [Mycobacterium sherrisii]
MAAGNELRVDARMMNGFAQALLGAAENLRSQLATLDGQVAEMLGGWQGGSGHAYSAAWQLWHRGASEVEAGLSILAAAVAHAGQGFQRTEAISAQAIRQVHDV